MSGPPPELGPTLTVRETAAALERPERTIRQHLKSGAIKGSQVAHQSPWVVPASEIERLAMLLWIDPNWPAALQVRQGTSNTADIANTAEVKPV